MYPARDLIQGRLIFGAALFGVIAEVLTGFLSYQLESLAAQEDRLVALEDFE